MLRKERGYPIATPSPPRVNFAAGNPTHDSCSRGDGIHGVVKRVSTEWITRKYVLRDLRLDGSRAIREIRVVCSRRHNNNTPVEDPEQQQQQGAAGAAGERWSGRRQPQQQWHRGVAGLAAYRCHLGEVVVGPWHMNARSMFRRVKSLRAVEISFRGGGGDGGGSVIDGEGSRDAGAELDVVVDLSLEWTLADDDGTLLSGGGAVSRLLSSGHRNHAPFGVLHWDLWQAAESGLTGGKGYEGGDGDGIENVAGRGWRWLGRAYGSKYRLCGWKLGDGSRRSKIVLAAQQVNTMGYRQVSGEMFWVPVGGGGGRFGGVGCPSCGMSSFGG